MTCYHPMLARYRDDGSVEVLRQSNADDLRDDEFLVPCGRCIGCRLKYSYDWACRMMLELEYSDCASFITLTYDDFNVPLSSYVDSNGERQVSMTLRPDDFTKFMKRLRKRFPEKRIRFYACGEYGDVSFRPHYHAIIFNCDFSDDRYLWSNSQDGFAQFRSETLESLWRFGNSMICAVSFDTCAYVARYVTKKHYGQDADFYEFFGIVPEFARMSRRPGIGNLYYLDNRDKIFERCEIFLSDLEGGKKIRPPRYFKKLYELDCPIESLALKSAAESMSDNICSGKLNLSDKSLTGILESEELAHEKKAQILLRSDV